MNIILPKNFPTRVSALVSLMICLVGMSAFGQVAAPSGLVAWFPLDDSATDMISAAVPVATNALSFVAGKVGNGATFGANGYIDLPNVTTWNNQRFSWEAWARWDGPGPTEDPGGSIIIENTLTNNFGYALSARASDHRFVYTCGTIISSAIVSSTIFTQGLFYHVAGTYDGTTFKLYVNGNLEAQQVDAGRVTYGNYWSIGANPPFARNSGFLRTWNGVIDEVSIYNRALSTAEIQSIYNAGSAGKYLPVQLTIKHSGTNVVLSWPTNSFGYFLQSTTDVTSTNWSNASPAPSLVTKFNQVTNPASGIEKFYRLSL